MFLGTALTPWGAIKKPGRVAVPVARPLAPQRLLRWAKRRVVPRGARRPPFYLGVDFNQPSNPSLPPSLPHFFFLSLSLFTFIINKVFFFEEKNLINEQIYVYGAFFVYNTNELSSTSSSSFLI